MRMATLMAIAVLGASGAALAQVGTTPSEQKGQMTNPATTANPSTNPSTMSPGMNPAASPPDTMTPDDMSPANTTSPDDSGMDNSTSTPDQVGNSF